MVSLLKKTKNKKPTSYIFIRNGPTIVTDDFHCDFICLFTHYVNIILWYVKVMLHISFEFLFTQAIDLYFASL